MGISVSSYYSYRSYKENAASKPAAKKKQSGRKIPGYSVNIHGCKIYDDTIKDYIIEIISGDGYCYGYRKITEDLRDDYELIINHKKVYRLCRELKILRNKPKMYPNRPKNPVQKVNVDGPDQLWQMDLKYG